MENTLYGYYQSQGQALPSVQQRQGVATQAGIQNYRGTAEQNTQLLNFLRGNTATSGVRNTSTSTTPGGTIDGSRLGTTPNTQVPPPVNTNNAQMNLGNQTTTFTEGITGNQQLEQQNQQAQQAVTPANSRQGILDKISSLLGVQSTQGQVTADIFNEEGVQAKKDLVRNLENEALAKERAYMKQAEKIRQNTEGKLESGIQIDLANLERQRNSELADIAIQSKIAQGNYQSAYEIADAKVKAQFEPIENQIKTLQALYGLYQNDLSESEKMEAQAKINERQAQLDFARQKELINYKAQIDLAQKISEQQAGGLLGTAEQQAKFIANPTAKQASSRVGIIKAIKDYTAKLEQYAGPAGVFDFDRLSTLEKRELETALNTTVGSAINVAQGQGAMGNEEAERILNNLRPRRIRTSVIKSAGQGVIDAQTSLLNSELDFLSLEYPNVKQVPMFNINDPAGLNTSGATSDPAGIFQ